MTRLRVLPMICLSVTMIWDAPAAKAASQLAPFFEALIKHKDSQAPPDVDLSKVLPSEEMPALISALESGNPIVMNAATAAAATILQIHTTAGENFNLRQLQPPLPEVIREFKVLVPIVTAHFSDVQPATSYLSNGNNDYPEIEWRTHVVQFMDVIGATPSPDMLAWMLVVVQWPSGGRATASLARAEAAGVTSAHDALVRAVKEDARATAIKIGPVLSHLNPMPVSVESMLTRKIDDVDEPQVAALIIFHLSTNRSVSSDLVYGLLSKALDKSAPVEVRVASIHTFAKLNPAAAGKLAGLLNDPDERIAHAVIDIGVER